MKSSGYTLVIIDKNVLVNLYNSKQEELLFLPRIKVIILDLIYYRLLFSSNEKENNIALSLTGKPFLSIFPTYDGTRIASEMIKKEPKYYSEEEKERIRQIYRGSDGFGQEVSEEFLSREREIAHSVEEIDVYNKRIEFDIAIRFCDKQRYIKTDLSKYLILSEDPYTLSGLYGFYEDYNTPKFIQLRNFIEALEKSNLIESREKVYKAFKEKDIVLSEELTDSRFRYKDKYLCKDFIFDMTGKENIYHTKEEAFELFEEGKISLSDLEYLGNFDCLHDVYDFGAEMRLKKKEKGRKYE